MKVALQLTSDLLQSKEVSFLNRELQKAADHKTHQTQHPEDIQTFAKVFSDILTHHFFYGAVAETSSLCLISVECCTVPSQAADDVAYIFLIPSTSTCLSNRLNDVKVLLEQRQMGGHEQASGLNFNTRHNIAPEKEE